MPQEKRNFTVMLERENAGGYSIYCPALPGCVSQGDDRAEAIENIKEAITLVLEVLEEDAAVRQGNPPEPRVLETISSSLETPDVIAQKVKDILINRAEDGLSYEGVSIEKVELVVGAPV